MASSSSRSPLTLAINSYNKYSPSPSSNTGNLTSDELCKIAITDAWHDHHTIKGLKPVDIAKKHLHNNKCYPPNPLNEDQFMYERILHTDAHRKYARPVNCVTDELENWNSKDATNKIGEIALEQNIYTSLVSERYRVFHIASQDIDDIVGSPTPTPTPTPNISLIQKVFTTLNINDDIHFIRDVGYGNLADDINKWDTAGDQSATFLITSQGQYDPGPTTTCITDAGERLGMGAKNIKYLNNNPNKNVKFGIYNTS